MYGKDLIGYWVDLRQARAVPLAYVIRITKLPVQRMNMRFLGGKGFVKKPDSELRPYTVLGRHSDDNASVHVKKSDAYAAEPRGTY